MGDKKVTNNEKIKKGKSKKGIIITIIIVLVILAVSVIGYFAYIGNQVELLDTEINKAIETLENIADENGTINKDAQIDMKIKTTGKFAIIEETYKNYINEMAELSKQADDIFDEETFENILSEENIKNDGPEFIQSKAKISEAKTKTEEYFDKVIEICSKEKMLTLLDDKEISNFYKETYREAIEEAIKSENLEKTIEDLKKSKTQVSKAYEYLNKIITFLSDNKSSWTFEDGQITFNSQTKLNQYNELVKEVPEID